MTVLRRAAIALLTLVGASVLIWTLLPLAPGDPAVLVLSARGDPTPQQAQIAAIRAEFGLDDPLIVQYGRWAAGAVHGDLGDSYRTSMPVTDGLADRVGPTVRLTVTAVAMATAFALVGGLVAAAFAHRWPDHLVRLYCAVFGSVPGFVLGIVLLYVVVVGFGRGSVVSDGSWSDAVLPAACLAAPTAGRWTQILRAGLLEASAAEYHLVAAARGASRLRLLVVHTLPNALPPLLTAIGLGLAYLFGGTAVIEAVFTWPGLGSYLLAAVRDRDLPVVQAVTLLSTAAFVGTSFLVDSLIRLVDPRVPGASR